MRIAKKVSFLLLLLLYITNLILSIIFFRVDVVHYSSVKRYFISHSRKMGTGVRGSQNCARCRNHGLTNSLKGHKKNCIFRDCECEKCLETKDRQKYIAEEIANHRESDATFDDISTVINSGFTGPVYEEISDDSSSQVSQLMIESLSSPTVSESRKDQHCSRCRNHGFDQILKGHKSFCPYRFCQCVKCEVTVRRREVMAKQIKDYRDSKSTITSSSMYEITPDLAVTSQTPDISNFCIQQFVDYEPEEQEPGINSDLFFMIQSLFEKYACQGNNEKIQFVRAFTELANFDWQNIESALEKGKCGIEMN